MAKVQFDPELMRNIKIIYGDADLDERTLRQLHQTWATNPDIIRRTAQQKMPKLQEAYFDAPEMPSLPTRLEPLPTAEIAQDDLRGVKTAFRAARERGLKQFMWGNSVYTTDLGQPSSKPKQPSTIQIPQSDTQISIEAPDLIATTKGTTWGRGIPTITGGSQPASEQTRAEQPSSKPKVNPVQATISRYTMGTTVQGGDFGIHRGLQRLFNYLGDVWNSRKSEAKPLTLSPGHTTKFQQGGTMNNQQELQKAFVAYLIQDAQSQGVQIQSEQDLQAYAEQLGEDGIKAKYQEFMQKMQGGTMNNQQELQKAFVAYLIQDAQSQGVQIQSEQDLQAYAEQLGEDGIKAKYQEFMQKMQGGTMARLGAKLEYYKKLKGVCPEGEELVYFKQGGRICKACQKAQKGTKVTKKANEVDKFKAGRAQYKKDMKSARDEASRDSISINKYNDQETMANKGHKGNFQGGKWVPDRKQYAKKDACGSKMKVNKCGSKMKKK